MPAAQRITIKSPAQSHVNNTTLRFVNFVPTAGPNGGRLVVDMLELVMNMTDITVATAATEGEDVWRAIENLTVEQVDGVQRYSGIQGDAHRIYCYDVMGADRVPEFADLATGANQSLVWAFPIPLEKRYAVRPKDFSLPAELLREVRFQVPSTSATGLAVGGGTVTINAANYYMLAHCHEEFAVEQKAVDMVGVSDFPSTTGITLQVNGRLQNLHIFARGAAGGAAATGLTELRIDGVLPTPLLRNPDLLQPYLRAKGAALNDANAADGAAVRNDPAGAGKSVPVLFSDMETSAFDGPILDQAVIQVTSGSLASAKALYRVVLPRSETIERIVQRRHGLTAGDFRMKTAAKSKRDPNRWAGEQAAFMPTVATLKRRLLGA